MKLGHLLRRDLRPQPDYFDAYCSPHAARAAPGTRTTLISNGLQNRTLSCPVRLDITPEGAASARALTCP